MKLLEWEVYTGIRSYQSEVGEDSTRYIPCILDVPLDYRMELYRLSDYVVSTGCAGGTMWLCERKAIG